MSENSRQSLAREQVALASLAAPSWPAASASTPASTGGHERSQQHIVVHGWSQGGGGAQRTPWQTSASGGYSASGGRSAASPGAASDVGSAASEAASPVPAPGEGARVSPLEPQPSKPAPNARMRIGEAGNRTGIVLG
jgi:hypothetical protein